MTFTILNQSTKFEFITSIWTQEFWFNVILILVVTSKTKTNLLFNSSVKIYVTRRECDVQSVVEL